MPAAYTIQGRTLTLPVEVRAADSWAAQYLVPAGRARRLVSAAGLEPASPLPGRAIVTIAFVRYADTDLGAYNEIAVAVLVRRHDAPPASAAGMALEVARTRVATYIHLLPVNEAFTLEAGREIWGYPKLLAEIAIAERGRDAVCTLRHEGELVLQLTVRQGGPLRLPLPSVPTYTHLGGVLRLTRWEVLGGQARSRPGGASITLGPHPMSDDLRALGLPRRALISTTVRGLRARFLEPTVLVRSAALDQLD